MSDTPDPFEEWSTKELIKEILSRHSLGVIALYRDVGLRGNVTESPVYCKGPPAALCGMMQEVTMRLATGDEEDNDAKDSD